MWFFTPKEAHAEKMGFFDQMQKTAETVQQLKELSDAIRVFMATQSLWIGSLALILIGLWYVLRVLKTSEKESYQILWGVLLALWVPGIAAQRLLGASQKGALGLSLLILVGGIGFLFHTQGLNFLKRLRRPKKAKKVASKAPQKHAKPMPKSTPGRPRVKCSTCHRQVPDRRFCDSCGGLLKH